MEITFKTRKLEKQLTQPKELKKAFGQMAKRVSQRMEDLKAAETLAIMRTIPGTRCHEYTGNRNELSVDVTGNYRIIFKPDYESIPKKEDGGLDWDQVKKIKILYVEDPH